MFMYVDITHNAIGNIWHFQILWRYETLTNQLDNCLQACNRDSIL